ncbi:MAG: YmfQ family protein [Oscillospiraceae bacterium]|jgi:hypothetical protein|nr:YmfQ family protein [Oscillospiraceae bacterium]
MIEYLPEFMREFREIKEITRVGDEWFAEANAAVDAFLDAQFAARADGNGLARWERLFGITPKGGDSGEERRLRVLARLSERLPYTYASLRRALSALCSVNGEDEYSVSVNHADYTVKVRLNRSVESALPAVARLLSGYIPANMTVDLSLVCNTVGIFFSRTHGEMGAHTHGALRNEQFD